MSSGAHVCPHTGAAHQFVVDENDIGVCGCGALDLAPGVDLDVVEMSREEPLPAKRAERFYGRLADILIEHDPDGFAQRNGDRDEFVRELVDGVKRPPDDE